MLPVVYYISNSDLQLAVSCDLTLAEIETPAGIYFILLKDRSDVVQVLKDID